MVEFTQRRRGYFDPARQAEVDAPKAPAFPKDEGDFRFPRGATILVDPESLQVRRVIRTRGTVLDDRELERVRTFLTRDDPNPPHAFSSVRPLHDGLAFAHIHERRV